jgi:hypothetical protein
MFTSLVVGCSTATDYAWCATHVEDVNAQFLARVYGGEAVFRSGETELKARLRAYFADPAQLPDGMTEDERTIADDSCRAARAHPLSSN